MHAKLERLLSKSLTTLEVMAYYLVVHTGPGTPTEYKVKEIIGTDTGASGQPGRLL